MRNVPLRDRSMRQLVVFPQASQRGNTSPSMKARRT
jgi:hypothetical protein